MKGLVPLAILACFLVVFSPSLLASKDGVPHGGAPHSGVVDAHGVMIHYLERKHEGEALVFIPGLGDTAHMMRDFASRFADRNHVGVITRRGDGWSSVPKDGYDLPTRVEDIRAVLEALHIQTAILIGHSIASDELTAFAGKYPEREVA